jgi:hypothetical protein
MPSARLAAIVAAEIERLDMMRIVWRFDKDEVPFEQLLGPVPPVAIQRLDLPTQLAPRVSPVFAGSREDVDEESKRIPGFLAAPVNDLARYYQTYVSSEDEALAVFQSLEVARQEGLLAVYDLQREITVHHLTPGGSALPAAPCIPDMNLDDPSLAWDMCQGYLGPGTGVDALFAWTLKGGTGLDIRVADIEKGWNHLHEDLQARICATFGDFTDICHGTAVLGIVAGDGSNPFGIKGIAHEACLGLSPFERQPGHPPNPEEAIRRTLQWLRKGDVLLVEVQARRNRIQSPNCPPYLPIEAWPQGQAAINLATAQGIYVVEVAGNGGLDLAGHGVPESGAALIVGAGTPGTGERMACSNHGTRVDLQGWGSDVVTTGASECDGYADLQLRSESRRCYTRSFGGTSAAAAIVAGCVATISGVLKAHGFSPLPLDQMKKLLVETGMPPGPGLLDGIGPLPNLRMAFLALEAKLKVDHPGFPGFIKSA